MKMYKVKTCCFTVAVNENENVLHGCGKLSIFEGTARAVSFAPLSGNKAHTE